MIPDCNWGQSLNNGSDVSSPKDWWIFEKLNRAVEAQRRSTFKKKSIPLWIGRESREVQLEQESYVEVSNSHDLSERLGKHEDNGPISDISTFL